MFDKKEKQTPIDEIVHGLKEAEKNYRWAKNGLEIAQGVRSLEARTAEAAKELASLETQKKSLAEDIGATELIVQQNMARARTLVNETEVQIADMKNKAQADILSAQNAADIELKAAASRLAAVNEEIQEESIKRDAIRADIKFLNEEKEKTRQRILDGTA